VIRLLVRHRARPRRGRSPLRDRDRGAPADQQAHARRTCARARSG